MRCSYCESETNDFVSMNQTVEYSGIEMAVNRQGMLRVRVFDKEVPDMEKRTIWVKPSCFTPGFEMIIPVPHVSVCGSQIREDLDDEEYIDELLDGILTDKLRSKIEWDFVDGLN